MTVAKERRVSEEDKPIWKVLWCSEAWLILAEMLKDVLPRWASLEIVDASRPLEQQVADADVIIPTTATVTAEAIAAATKVKLVVQPAAGYDNIALEACASRSIPVCTMPGLNAASVAEGALCCMLMLARRATEQQDGFRRRELGLPLGMQLAGKTLGIVGYGSVGKRLAQTTTAMGMRILSTDSRSSRADLERLLASADVVSLHCPLNASTRGLIGRREIALMRDGALLVNYARGEVVDEEAVTEAVFSGKLGGLGLDVHWIEPADPSEPLYAHPRVLAFPHSGTATHEVMATCRDFLAGNVAARRDGRPLQHELDVQALARKGSGGCNRSGADGQVQT